jgi:hypothetical protein
METIHKYQIHPAERFVLKMPEDAEILCVQMQDKRPCLWARVDLDDENVGRFFRIVGTGQALPADKLLSYVGSFQMYDGQFVGHLFEEVGGA